MTEKTRPTELRYRLADFINDRLRILPGFHRALKSAFSRVAPSEPIAKEEPGGSELVDGQTSVSVAHATESTLIPGMEESATADKPGSSLQQANSVDALPFPPLEMRELVGPTELEAFDNPTGSLVFDYMDPKLDPKLYERVFDFGCGCGRIARQLIMQRPTPKLYVGIDLHAGMIRWCQRNLQPAAPAFTFLHHDVFHVGFNPNPGRPLIAPFPVADSQFTLVIAHSVFTHLTQEQAVHYLRECARILDPEGVLYASWFLFDKKDYPMMHEHNNALYVSYEDPGAAVIVDRQWVKNTANEMGLKICWIVPPWVRGHQWLLMMTRQQDVQEPEFPPDNAPRGFVRPPMGSGRDLASIGAEPE